MKIDSLVETFKPPVTELLEGRASQIERALAYQGMLLDKHIDASIEDGPHGNINVCSWTVYNGVSLKVEIQITSIRNNYDRYVFKAVGSFNREYFTLSTEYKATLDWEFIEAENVKDLFWAVNEGIKWFNQSYRRVIANLCPPLKLNATTWQDHPPVEAIKEAKEISEDFLDRALELQGIILDNFKTVDVEIAHDRTFRLKLSVNHKAIADMTEAEIKLGKTAAFAFENVKPKIQKSVFKYFAVKHGYAMKSIVRAFKKIGDVEISAAFQLSNYRLIRRVNGNIARIIDVVDDSELDHAFVQIEGEL